MINETSVAKPNLSFRRLVSVGISTKFVVDTGYQIFNPFLAIFAAGFGVDIIAMGRLISLLNIVGVTSPLFGVLSNRFGYRAMLRLALVLCTVGILILGLTVSLWMTVVGFIFMGMGFAGFVPMLHAYLSLKIPYAERARAIGIVEFSWALSSIIGLFLMGFLIELTNWRFPFFVLAGGLIIAWQVFGMLPADQPVTKITTLPIPSQSRWLKFKNYLNFGDRATVVWGAILVYSLNYFGMLHVIIVHGVWLTQEYGLSARGLGTVALILGLADLSGSGLVSLISDKVGKRRSIIFGTSLSWLVYMTLPFFNVTLVSVVMSLVLLRAAFEFSLVSNLPLLTELVPNERGKVLTLNVVVSLISATLIGFTGPWAYTTFGVWGLGPLSAAAVTLSLFILWRWVEDVDGDSDF